MTASTPEKGLIVMTQNHQQESPEDRARKQVEDTWAMTAISTGLTFALLFGVRRVVQNQMSIIANQKVLHKEILDLRADSVTARQVIRLVAPDIASQN